MPYTPIPEEIFHDEALRVWNDGAPQAASPAHARVEWAPYLCIWQQEIKRDFGALIRNDKGARRLSWIDNADFWKSFWYASRRYPMENSEEQWYLRLCVETSAAAGNMSFFECLPKPNAEQLLQFLEYTTYVADPKVVQWCRKNHPSVKVAQGCETALCKLHWDTGALARAVSGREGMPFLSIVETVCEAARPFSFGCERIAAILGHLFVHAVPQNGAQDAMVTMKTALGEGLLGSIDLPLVALCSGHDVNQDAGSKTIAAMARNLNNKSGTEWAALSALMDIDGISDNRQLYNAVRGLGLHRTHAHDTFDVDGTVFASDDAHP